MFDFLAHLFDSSGFPPRWNCGNWTEGHGWLHVLSDLGVWSAYLAIPCVLGFFVLRRRDIPFRTIFLLFGAFIFACGTTHLMEAIIFWWPIYRLAGIIKLFTALASWATVAALIPVVPKVLAMRSPEALEREIAARKHAEDALQRANAELERRVEERTAQLRESEERHRLLVERNPYAIFIHARDRVVFANPAAARLLGTDTPEQLIGRSQLDFIHAALHAALQESWQQVIATGAALPLTEQQWVRSDGATVDVEVTAYRFVWRGEPQIKVIARDITNRKRAEEGLRQQREWFRTTLSSIGDAVIVCDTESRVTFLNPVAQAMTGWREEQATGMPLSAVFPIINETTRQPVENPVAKVIEHGVMAGLANHTVLVARDGTELPIDDSAAPIRDNHGKIAGVVLVFRDVTERRRVEQANRGHQEILQLVHKIGKIGYWEWNSSTDENKWSPEIEALYGLAPGTFEGGYAGWAKLLHPDDLPTASDSVGRAMETGGYFTEFRVVWPDGSVHWLEARANVFRDGPDQAARLVGVNMDVTERKRIEQELRQSQQELKRRIEQLAETDRRKDEFLVILSHELRNPLAPIKNSLYILRLRGLEDPQLRWARDMIERQVEHMTRLVDDLLDISRISRGKIELRKQVVDLADIVKGATESTRPLFIERRHELTVSLPTEPVRLHADPTRLEQILSNLLNNSAKYTEPGGRIWLTAERDGTNVLLRVRDTGIGIGPTLLPQIFEMFVQADHAKDQAKGGLGIGLSLVRSFVEMHGGGITAFSEGPGKGSEFLVRLPALPQGPTAEDPAIGPAVELPAPAPVRHVLVVDDNVDAAESLAMVLRLSGHEVRVAHDGQTALEAFQALRPVIVFLDIGLPGIDGYEVARRIRRLPEGERVLLFALTGWGQEENRRQSREAGFDQHLVKPLEPSVMQKILADLEVTKE